MVFNRNSLLYSFETIVLSDVVNRWCALHRILNTKQNASIVLDSYLHIYGMQVYIIYQKCNRLSKIVHFTKKVLSLKVVHLPIACQSERSLCYFHLGRSSDLFSLDRSSFPHAAKRFSVA